MAQVGSASARVLLIGSGPRIESPGSKAFRSSKFTNFLPSSPPLNAGRKKLAQQGVLSPTLKKTSFTGH